MTVTATYLRDYVGASADALAFVTACLAEAVALVEDYVGDAGVPEPILDRAIVEVGSELFHRQQAPSGIRQFAVAEGGGPVRVARDPMLGAYPLLARYMGGPFA